MYKNMVTKFEKKSGNNSYDLVQHPTLHQYLTSFGFLSGGGDKDLATSSKDWN